MRIHGALILVLTLWTNFTNGKTFVDDVVVVKTSDEYLSIPEVLSKYGYKSESYSITTEDDYILQMYRIPHGKRCEQDPNEQKIAVLVVHGAVSSSFTFVENGEDHGLAYVLADRCFDVWLGNNRGNFESTGHVYLNRTDNKYWDFSWHEMGVYDIKSMVDFILETTGQSQLHYIGHSQGTTVFFVYASTYPEESAKKVRSMHAMAPIAFVDHVESIGLHLLGPLVPALKVLTGILDIHQLFPVDGIFTSLAARLCTSSVKPIVYLCAAIVFSTCGSDWKNTNDTAWVSNRGHYPAGGSRNQYLHYGQLLNSGGFRQYDHGPVKNLILYGQVKPPDYHLEEITVPMYLHYGKSDMLSNRKNSEILARRSPNAKVRPVDNFNHYDFTISNNVKLSLYNLMIDHILEDSEGMLTGD